MNKNIFLLLALVVIAVKLTPTVVHAVDEKKHTVKSVKEAEGDCEDEDEDEDCEG